MCKLIGIIGCLLPAIAASAGPQPSNSWQELGQLNFGRFGCKAQNIDGFRAIVFGGTGNGPGTADLTAEILDTTTGEWAFTAPMPLGFVPGPNPWTAKLKDGYFLVAGGFNALQTGSLESYIYSVSTNTWIRTGDLPVGATIGSNYAQTDAIVLDDGRVLAAGGLTIDVFETRASMVFKPNYKNLANGLSGTAVGTWDFTRDRSGKITQLSGPTEHHKLIKLIDGRVLLIVGYDRRFVSRRWGAVYRDTPGVQAELFDPASGKWTPLPNLPAIPGEDDQHDGVQGVRQQAAVALLGDGRVLVSGGFSEPTDSRGTPLTYYVRSSAILFDPVRWDAGYNPWSITGSMHVARESHVMGNLSGSAGILSVWGWGNDDQATATAEVYDPGQGVWRFVSGLPAFPDTDQPISLPPGCSAIMPGGRILVMGGVWDDELGGRSRRTYYYQP